jgi:hypothetical protein
MSLFNFAVQADFENLDEYSRTRKPANSNVDFEDIVRSIITSRQAEKLRGMIRFTFTRHERLNLPEYRLTAIERQLQKRVTQLLDIAKERGKARTADATLLERLEANKRKIAEPKGKKPPEKKKDKGTAERD